MEKRMGFWRQERNKKRWRSFKDKRRVLQRWRTGVLLLAKAEKKNQSLKLYPKENRIWRLVEYGCGVGKEHTRTLRTLEQGGTNSSKASCSKASCDGFMKHLRSLDFLIVRALNTPHRRSW